MGKKKIEVLLEADMLQQFKEVARSRGFTMAGYIRNFIVSSIEKHNKPTRVVYDPCSLCGKRHDESEHFPLSRHS